MYDACSEVSSPRRAMGPVPEQGRILVDYYRVLNPGNEIL